MINLTPKPSQSLFVYRMQSIEKLFPEKKKLLKDKGGGGLNKKWKEGFFNCSHYGD